MAWQFILTDLNGNVHGELLNADERKVSVPHMRIPTASFKLPLWHPLAPTVMDTDCLLRAYRTDPLGGTRTLAFHGPVLTGEEVGDENTKTVVGTCAGPFGRLTSRLIGKTKAGISWGVGAPIDLGLIAHNVLDTINADNFTGITKGTRTASLSGGYGPQWLKVAAEAIAELSSGLNSFEFVVTPTEPTNVAGVGGWPQIGVMNILPLIGTTKQDAIFEYGTSRANVASYNRTVSRDGLLTKGYINVNGWPDGTIQDLLTSTASTLGARGLFESVVDDNGVMDDGLRQSIVDFNILIRKNPRQLITFKPVTNASPSPFTNYNVGDTIRARAEVGGSVRFDGLFRVWGITFDIDKNGNENVELELVMP